jgi:hypothetical protein
MPTNLENLKAKILALAGELSDELDRLEAIALVDEWYATRLASAALDAGNVQAYSLLGRQVTKKDGAALAARASELYAQIKARLYGRGVVLADMGGEPIDRGVPWR